MAEPSGHTQVLGVINRAIDEHRDAPPWRDVIARTSGHEGRRRFAVEVWEENPGKVVDRYTIRVHEGRIEVLIEHGASEPPNRVATRASTEDRSPPTIDRDSTLLDAHRLLVEEEVHGAPVVEPDGEVVGVISTLDILRAVQEQ